MDRHEGEDYDAGDEDYRNSIIQVGTNKYKNRPTRSSRSEIIKWRKREGRRTRKRSILFL